MARVSLTQKQLKTPEGKELLDLLMTLTEDGVIDDVEVEDLRDWLEEHEDCEIPAIRYLLDTLNAVEANNKLDLTDCWNVLLAIERVVPPDQRALIKVRRRDTPAPATDRQIEFLSALGVDYGSDLSKAEASELITDLKEEQKQIREHERDERAPSTRRRSSKKKADEDRMGCGCWLTLVFGALCAIGYCTKTS